MKYRRIMAAIAAMTMMFTAFSCGKDKTVESEVGETTTSSAEADKENSTGDDSEETEAATDKDGNKTTDKKGDKSGKTTTTAKAGDKSGTTTTKSGGSGNSGGSSGGSSSGGNSSSGGGSSSGGNTGTGDEEVKEYTAEVTLGSSPKVSGSNVSVSGSVVTITAGGDYIFRGSVSDGQICVDTATEEKVTVVLDGVDISNSAGPAIFINEAKKCTVKVREGTVNYLRDGGKDKINDGVIFSNDTLRLKGNGELNIVSGNAHGIASDDDIIIENGTYNITSIKSGIFAHDDISITGGTLNIKGGTNGIKSKGTINISGGTTVVSGGTKEEKSSIYSASTFNYTGGYVYAAGNQVSVPTYSDYPYILVDLGESASAGTPVEMVLNGYQMAAFEPHNNFRCLLMLAPDISAGSSFYTVIGGNGSEEFSVSDGQNYFNLR